jgi:hypothetical protein
MQEIKCPNCGEVIQVDESDYMQIVQQVRDKEFDKELDRREQALKAQQAADAEIQRMKQAQDHERTLTKKDQEIAELKAKLTSSETEKELAVEEALHAVEQKLSEKATEITDLQGKLANKETQAQLREKSLMEQHAIELRLKDEQIEYYRDFKARQSTKMIGESLEQHCMDEFNKLRMTAFPNAYFEKDNDAKSGSKGDFIFRDYDNGTEFISIMFEMKNEADATATKHKNEHFFKELDKDRTEKKCEYAVLVSMLESDSELYNNGIVDVSYKYPKMYVIRPQFFIPLITLLRNAARNSLGYQQQLQEVRNQQIDIRRFEENMFAFKEAFANNYRLASERFQKAIEEIDTTIKHLEKIKEHLTKSENQLRLANNKADELTIKKLTKDAPSVKAMFDALKDSANT